MSSFLDRLKKKEVVPTTPLDAKQEKIAEQNKAATVPAAAAPPADQLKVDIYHAPTAFIIYAQVAGALITDFDVTIEGDGDIVTIKGERRRPTAEHFQQAVEGMEHVLEECSWGKFYRQIILPAEVDAEKAEAKMKEGVLMLLLPPKNLTHKGVKIAVTEVHAEGQA